MIDIHCHLLPGVDDGAHDLDHSIEMARAAVASDVEAIVATPHVSRTYMTAPASLAQRVAEVQQALDGVDVPLRVHVGAEIAQSMFADLDDDALRACALGGGRYILLEPPYAGPAPFIDRMVDDLEQRGFGVVLAHPERIGAFHRNLSLLEKLVDQGALCSVTAMSAAGEFGGQVKKFTAELFRRGLVHNLASDAHDADYRSPGMKPVLEKAVENFPGLEEWLAWMTDEVPRAILGAEAVDTTDSPRLESRRGLFRRMRR